MGRSQFFFKIKNKININRKHETGDKSDTTYVQPDSVDEQVKFSGVIQFLENALLKQTAL